MNVRLKALFKRTNAIAFRALEDAAELALARTHYQVEVEHLLLALLDLRESDFPQILRRFEVDDATLTASILRVADKFRRGCGRDPDFSPQLVEVLERSWTEASLGFGSNEIRTGFIVLTLLGGRGASRLLDENTALRKIDTTVLRAEFADIVSKSSETKLAAREPAGEAKAAAKLPAAGGLTPNLDQYTVNLTENAKNGRIDPVLGRDAEIRQIVDILMRRRQNNPILTGEAGVGKTAVVEGFALRVAQGDVPEPLKAVAVRTLDLALLQAGAGVKGEFENRLKGLIEEVKKSAAPIVLFIDEAHTMIGAGGQAGQNDAANLLKPALARGELRTIAATTWSEYKKYFEKDPALARRFQVVKVEEPSEVQCVVMLRGILGALEKHHGVRILDEGMTAAVRLSHRYLAGRQLPDKAVSVLDTACARLSLGQNATPAAIEDLRRQVDDSEVLERILRRETATGSDHAERLEQLTQKHDSLKQELATLETKWEKIKALIVDIRALREELERKATSNEGEDRELTNRLREELGARAAELDGLQGGNAMTQVCVDAQVVGQVIAAWTGIPLGKMLKDEIGSVLSLDRHLGQRVIGQDHALQQISQRIQTGRAGLDDPAKPLGVFLLTGPSGVGKTETALALSDLLYGGERNLITINMSEFQEAHTVSTLKGSPPGYVGFGEGGVLTEAVRRRPYSVVLLDEVEKAHPDVLELFYQVFDRGMMEDGEGREIDFKNTIILLTTNAGTDAMMSLCANGNKLPGSDEIVSRLKPLLNRVFKPAFLGRMVIVPYYPVRDETLRAIIKLKLKKIQRRMEEGHKLELVYDDAVIAAVAARCTEVESGARNVDNILTNTLLPDISRQLLTSMAAGERLERVKVSIGDDGGFHYLAG